MQLFAKKACKKQTYTYTYAPKGDKENKGETENKGDTENKKETENNGETENTDKKVKAKFKITPKAVRKGKKTTVKITSTSGGKITIKGKSKNAKNKKYVKISGSKVVFQKKAPKGTYKFTVTSAAKGNYLKTTKTISIKVK